MNKNMEAEKAARQEILEKVTEYYNNFLKTDKT